MMTRDPSFCEDYYNSVIEVLVDQDIHFCIDHNTVQLSTTSPECDYDRKGISDS